MCKNIKKVFRIKSIIILELEISFLRRYKFPFVLKTRCKIFFFTISFNLERRNVKISNIQDQYSKKKNIWQVLRSRWIFTISENKSALTFPFTASFKMILEKTTVRLETLHLQHEVKLMLYDFFNDIILQRLNCQQFLICTVTFFIPRA